MGVRVMLLFVVVMWVVAGNFSGGDDDDEIELHGEGEGEELSSGNCDGCGGGVEDVAAAAAAAAADAATCRRRSRRLRKRPHRIREVHVSQTNGPHSVAHVHGAGMSRLMKRWTRRRERGFVRGCGQVVFFFFFFFILCALPRVQQSSASHMQPRTSTSPLCT